MARRVRLLVPTEVRVRDIDIRTLDAVDRASKHPIRRPSRPDQSVDDTIIDNLIDILTAL